MQRKLSCNNINDPYAKMCVLDIAHINCGCECDKSCRIGKYLDYKSCVCRKTIVDKLTEECTNVIDENKIYNETLNITYQMNAVLVRYMLYYLQCF